MQQDQQEEARRPEPEREHEDHGSIEEPMHVTVTPGDPAALQGYSPWGDDE